MEKYDFCFLKIQKSLFAENQVSASIRFDTILDFKSNCMLTDDIRDLASPFVVMCTVLSKSELLAMRSKLRIMGQSQCSTLGRNSAFYTFFFLLLAGKVHALVQPNEV